MAFIRHTIEGNNVGAMRTRVRSRIAVARLHVVSLPRRHIVRTLISRIRDPIRMGSRRVSTRSNALLRDFLVLALLATVHTAIARNLDQLTNFNIAAQTLDKALLDFGAQAHVQVMFATHITRRLRTHKVTGNLTDRNALIALLRNSHLRFVQHGNTIEIVAMHTAATERVGDADPPMEVQDAVKKSSAKSDESQGETHSDTRRKAKANIERHGEQTSRLQEVVVTGTHISGGPALSAPIITITRQEIDNSGYQSVEQLITSLPENFASVGSGINTLQSNVNAGNAYGAAVDLRGLGFDSTLVLVNGHRLAPAGLYGAYTDVSVIPLSAIQRIDVITDGASSIYGADAIGGVVNFVLRSEERGAETSVEYGSVTRGGLKDYRVAQSFGTAWSSGSAFVAYEFHNTGALTTFDRDFSQSVVPSDLTPEQTQNSVYATAENSVSGNSQVAADGFYSTRTTGVVSAGTLPILANADTTQYNYALRETTALSDHWTVHDRISYGGNDAKVSDEFGLQAGDNGLTSASIAMDGPLFKVPAGPVEGAFGDDVRYEALDNRFTGEFSGTAIRKHRLVEAVYAESRVPLLGKAVNGVQLTTVSLDLAGRYEHYSDFGASTDPMIGVAWNSLRSLRIRGTASYSFRAPDFNELYGTEYSLLVNSPTSNGSEASVPALVLYGSNPKLKPEKSFEWSAGIDWTPTTVPTLSVHVTGYEIKFKDRIAAPGINQISPLSQGDLYASFIQMNPNPELLSTYGNPPLQFQNLTTFPGFGPPQALLDAQAIADDRLQNISETDVDGADVTGVFEETIGGVRARSQLNGTYLFTFRSTAFPGTPPIDVLSTLDNPVNFRARAEQSFSKGRWSLGGALNYVNHYQDTTGTTPVSIASWTTVDLHVSYDLPLRIGSGEPPKVLLDCVNCFDRDPPAVRLTSDFLGYDPANANALDRFVSVTLSATW